MNLALFILAVIGLTHVIVDSEIMRPFQQWVKPRCAPLAYIMNCHQCAGYWCGLFLGPLVSWQPLIWVACGFAGSFLAQFGYWTLNALEAYARGENVE